MTSNSRKTSSQIQERYLGEIFGTDLDAQLLFSKFHEETKRRKEEKKEKKKRRKERKEEKKEKKKRKKRRKERKEEKKEKKKREECGMDVPRKKVIVVLMVWCMIYGGRMCCALVRGTS